MMAGQTKAVMPATMPSIPSTSSSAHPCSGLSRKASATATIPPSVVNGQGVPRPAISWNSVTAGLSCCSFTVSRAREERLGCGNAARGPTLGLAAPPSCSQRTPAWTTNRSEWVSGSTTAPTPATVSAPVTSAARWSAVAGPSSPWGGSSSRQQDPSSLLYVDLSRRVIMLCHRRCLFCLADRHDANPGIFSFLAC